MKRIDFWIISLTLTLFLVSCGPGNFMIKDEEFGGRDWCSGTGTVIVSMKDGEVNYDTVPPIEWGTSGGHGLTYYCRGFIHQYKDTVEIAGYIFKSPSPKSPLRFKVKSGGYSYYEGTGEVIDPDGNVSTFPN